MGIDFSDLLAVCSVVAIAGDSPFPFNFFSPAEPPVDDPVQPARFGEVNAGTRPALPVGVEAFTLSIRAVSKNFDGRVAGKRVAGRTKAHFPCGEPGGVAPFLYLRGLLLLKRVSAGRVVVPGWVMTEVVARAHWRKKSGKTGF